MIEWLSDFNNWVSIITILGFLLTCYLLFEINKIKSSFLRKARLPEVIRELLSLSSLLSKSLNDWGNNKTLSLESFSQVKALLENIESKLPAKEKRKVNEYMATLNPSKCWLLKRSLVDLTDDEVWERYTELSGIIASLQQLNKDSKWD